ncbi:glycosyl transferase family 2 [Pseudonocardia dioxanivorans CB1190]|uniref:Glycosyl transferase family 2 n=1 Tax=Pseudonocardia dioxanivorans (strain ATCC 55486 / DSM 44775 / JCM 13855 / CB1190) TaxID=675635 RepID=F4CTC6_PSEUX|nr:glycosyl transferase family 2 [Pseudonocardia dioxanivorans CB1190]
MSHTRPRGSSVGSAPVALPSPSVSEPFTLLLPVWAGDRPDFLAAAFRSSVDDQHRRPDEVVIVRDGPVGSVLAAALDELAASSPVPVRIVALERNGGLGPALDAGLAAAGHDIVARMDADDVSEPHRFTVQLPIVEAGADLVGSGLIEFADDAAVEVGRRIPPTSPEEIRARSRFADPFNHPTVVLRRSLVQQVGGYGDFALMEDYLLWARMIMAGARVANVAEPLVRYRIGAGAYARRGGLGQLRAELALQRRFHAMGFTTPAQALRNVVVRGGYRLVPESLRRLAYRRVVAVHRPRATP